MRTFLIIVFSILSIVADAEIFNVSPGDIIEIGGQKALVFNVDYSGEHGTAICIKAFRGHESPFCSNGRLLKKLPDISNEEDGRANTMAVLKYALQEDRLDDFPVFKWCWQLGEGWYLPSSKELESFVAYWLGNNRVLNWDEESDDSNSEFSQPYYKIVNQKIVEAGGTPFLTNTYTSTVDSDRNICIFEFMRFWKREKLENWEIKKKKISSIDKNCVGRAFIKF